MLLGKASALDKVAYVDKRLTSLIGKAILLAEENPDGKYNIEGEQVFVILVSTSTNPREEQKSEIHKDHADIQIILQGSEVFGISSYAPETLQKQKMDNDVCFIPNIENESFVTLHQHDFIVFFPGEAHRPQCSVDNEVHDVRKAVVKIHKDWFNY